MISILVFYKSEWMVPNKEYEHEGKGLVENEQENKYQCYTVVVYAMVRYAIMHELEICNDTRVRELGLKFVDVY